MLYCKKNKRGRRGSAIIQSQTMSLWKKPFIYLVQKKIEPILLESIKQAEKGEVEKVKMEELWK